MAQSLLEHCLGTRPNRTLLFVLSYSGYLATALNHGRVTLSGPRNEDGLRPRAGNANRVPYDPSSGQLIDVIIGLGENWDVPVMLDPEVPASALAIHLTGTADGRLAQMMGY